MRLVWLSAWNISVCSVSVASVLKLMHQSSGSDSISFCLSKDEFWSKVMIAFVTIWVRFENNKKGVWYMVVLDSAFFCDCCLLQTSPAKTVADIHSLLRSLKPSPSSSRQKSSTWVFLNITEVDLICLIFTITKSKSENCWTHLASLIPLQCWSLQETVLSGSVAQALARPVAKWKKKVFLEELEENKPYRLLLASSAALFQTLFLPHDLAKSLWYKVYPKHLFFWLEIRDRE